MTIFLDSPALPAAHEYASRATREVMVMVGEEGTGERRARGRYLAEYVRVTGEDPAAQLQEELDAKEGKEWHLVGVSGGLKEGEVVLFWDTARPSFGRSSL